MAKSNDSNASLEAAKEREARAKNLCKIVVKTIADANEAGAEKVAEQLGKALVEARMHYAIAIADKKRAEKMALGSPR